jgi:hypothetical protein
LSKAVTYFECKRRIDFLGQFRDSLLQLPERADDASPADRRAINEAIPRVRRYLIDSGFYPLVDMAQPYVAGGRVFRGIDALGNIFSGVAEVASLKSSVLDYVDRAIGQYRDDLRHSLFRTFNPFWWLWRTVSAVVSLPFRLLTWAGFDGSRVEQSRGGRVVKIVGAVVTLVVVLAAILQILDSPTMTRWLSHWHR